MIKKEEKEQIDYQVMATALMKGADKSKAVFLSRFFKTGPGQYGEGDQFLGLSVPFVRAVSRQYRGVELEIVSELIASPYHDFRLLGLLILVHRYETAKSEAEKTAIVRFYHANRKGINNWDLVDLSVYKIWGDYLLRHPEKRDLLYRYGRSKNLWERRLAVVSTMALIKQGQFKEILELVVIMINDKEDLMHKAVGWMLREVGKKDEKVLRSFLNEYATSLPRTALRYAIERLPETVRLKYLRMK